MPDGGFVRDALAADPEWWLGAAHAARFGASPALLVKLLDAGERLPVHHHPDHQFAHEHLGLDFGKTEAWIVLAAREGAQVAVGWREDVASDTLRAWVDEQDHDALLGALNPVAVRAGDAVFVPAGVPHAIGDGILIAELQEPTDLSVLLEWDGFGIADEQAATLGLGWDVALASVERTARDPSALRGPARRRRRLTSCCPRRPTPSSPPSASRPAAAPWSSQPASPWSSSSRARARSPASR